jgi:hypothetical protein
MALTQSYSVYANVDLVGIYFNNLFKEWKK